MTSKIIQITAVSCWNPIDKVMEENIYGLGEDNQMYVWRMFECTWVLDEC